MNRFALHGTFVDTPTPDALRVRTGYLLCEDGVCAGFSPKRKKEEQRRAFAGIGIIEQNKNFVQFGGGKTG